VHFSEIIVVRLSDGFIRRQCGAFGPEYFIFCEIAFGISAKFTQRVISGIKPLYWIHHINELTPGNREIEKMIQNFTLKCWIDNSSALIYTDLSRNKQLVSLVLSYQKSE